MNTNQSEEPIDQSEPFEFNLDGVSYNAYVRYYDNGDMDMEISTDNPTEKAYEQAWVVADSLKLTRKLPEKPSREAVLKAMQHLLKNNI